MAAAIPEMVTIRVFEEQVNDLYRGGKMPGLTHLYIGEEAVAVGVCTALAGRLHHLAPTAATATASPRAPTSDRMFAELLGKEAGYCRGKGGSMHIADHANGNLGANAIVGGSAGIATGAAFSAKRRGTDQVAVCFFGDGALGQGLLYEVMNMAALWKLPVIYVCENNLYNEYTHYLGGRPPARSSHAPRPSASRPTRSTARTCARYARPQTGWSSGARRGGGPAFLLCDTYRYHGHHVGDVDRAYYRSKDEEEVWRRASATRSRCRELARRAGHRRRGRAERIEDDARRLVDAAVAVRARGAVSRASEVDQDVFA